MSYVRISLMTPRPGRAADAARLLDAVIDFCHTQPGYLGGFRLESGDESGMIGRVTIWEDEHNADAVAQTDHMLALRSALNVVVVEGTHEERGFRAYEAGIRPGGVGLSGMVALAEEIIGRAQDPASDA